MELLPREILMFRFNGENGEESYSRNHFYVLLSESTHYWYFSIFTSGARDYLCLEDDSGNQIPFQYAFAPGTRPACLENGSETRLNLNRIFVVPKCQRFLNKAIRFRDEFSQQESVNMVRLADFAAIIEQQRQISRYAHNKCKLVFVEKRNIF